MRTWARLRALKLKPPRATLQLAGCFPMASIMTGPPHVPDCAEGCRSEWSTSESRDREAPKGGEAQLGRIAAIHPQSSTVSEPGLNDRRRKPSMRFWSGTARSTRCPRIWGSSRPRRSATA
jgi:hypothetical protein